MKISDEAAMEFQKIWKSEYGEDISLDKAHRREETFLSFSRLFMETIGINRVNIVQF